MGRIVFGLLAPLVICFVVWVFGSPPATSLFWETADLTVTGHTSYEAQTGYGPATFHTPLVTPDPDKAPVKILLDGARSRAEVEAEWPVGSDVRVKIAPSGTHVYRTDDPRRARFVPLLVLLLTLVITGLTLASYIVALNTTSLLLGGIGCLFVLLPAGISAARWQIGDPPPLAHITWPTQQATIVDRAITAERIGNGTMRYTPDISVTYDGTKVWRVEGYRGGFQRDAERVTKRLEAVKTLKVNLDAAGRPFEARWTLQHILTVILSVITPFFILIGLFLIRAALPIKCKRT